SYRHDVTQQHFLNFIPLPQGDGSGSHTTLFARYPRLSRRKRGSMRKSVVMGALALSLTTGGAALTVAPDLLAHSKDFKEHRQEWQERRLERMSEELNLTADQKAKIKALFDDQRAKMKALHEETRTKMMALLTPDQKAKLEKLREEKGKKG